MNPIKSFVSNLPVIRSFVYRWRVLKAEVKNNTLESDAIRKRLDAQNMEMQRLNTRLTNYSERLKTANEKNRALNKDLKSLDKQFKTLNKELSASKRELSASKRELTASKKVLNDTILKLNNTSEELAKIYLSKDIERLHSRYLKIQSYITGNHPLIDQSVSESPDLFNGLNTLHMYRSENDQEALDALYREEADVLRNVDHLVSIIILNRNGKPKLDVLMNSLHERSFYSNFEIVFVDNASTDDSVAFMESWKEIFPIKIIRNDYNMSFSAANNMAVRESAGDLLLFLNNDTEVTDGWLDELIYTMEKGENPGAVGAKLVYPRIPNDTTNSGKSYSIQHAGIAFHPVLRAFMCFFQPYTINNGKIDGDTNTAMIERAAVTAAVLLMKRSAFEEVGGFDEKYNYGYEDVDLCLKLNKAGYHNYYCPTSLVLHYEFGTQQTETKEQMHSRRQQNMFVFKGKWQSWLTERIMDDKLHNRHLFTEDDLTIAFAVTSSGPDTTAGDYFTAMEFSQSLAKKGYKVKYLNRRGSDDWYNIGLDTDVLISMLDSYDLSKIQNARPDLVKIAWARNWFDRWCENESFEMYDLVFASSKTACSYVEEHSNKKAILFPIATNAKRFFEGNNGRDSDADRERFHSDYAFTGSNWNFPRDIIEFLEPERIPYEFKLYGANWDTIEKFEPYAQGFLKYDEIPKVYRNTKIIIDDANHVTKFYGSVNSRVYDALASGVLVLTNGVIGAEETFGGLLPYYQGKEELHEKLTFYLEHPEVCAELVQKLQKIVLTEHTYDIRAEKLVEILMQNNADYVDETLIDICCAIPGNETDIEWEDLKFATAMKRHIEQSGYQAQIRSRNFWYAHSHAKYTIVLRGMLNYYPSVREGRKYLMWNINNPSDLCVGEYNFFDRVFFASERMCETIGKKILPPSSVLQLSGDDLVMPHKESDSEESEFLFI